MTTTASPSAAVARVLERLPDARPIGDGWIARCPAHDDHDPSLSIDEGQDGRALLHCRSRNCPVERIVAALGLTLADLFDDAGRRNGHTPGAGDKRIVATYGYRDAGGELLYEVVRFDPKDFKQRRPDGRGGWIWNTDGVARVLYRLPELLAADSSAIIFVVEGEKDTNRLAALGLVATTNAGGAGKWRDDYTATLRGRNVVILTDNDKAGRDHGEQVARSLHAVAASVKVITLPGLPEKGDVSDWLDAGGTAAELFGLAEAAREWERHETEAASGAEESAPRGRTPQATRLIELTSSAELWHTPDHAAYASIEIDGHTENWALRSGGFRAWLARCYYEAHHGAPGSQALQDALGVLEAQARYAGACLPVFLRVGECNGRTYLDLADQQWRAVEIDRWGWRIVDHAPVRFRRSKSMLALPPPVPGGVIVQARPFLNLSDDDDFRLVVGFMLGALRASGPYPVLDLNGEQGSAKSTNARVVRALFDPATAPLRSLPRDERDLAIAAAGNWCFAIDNVSSLPQWLSDALCRLATGGGFSTRQLYSDDEEIIFNHQRPAILTGITEFIRSHDLLDRALVLTLPPIAETERRDEASFWAAFELARPRILGALLDGVSAGLRDVGSIHLERLPRMADFARWVCAAVPAFGWQGQDFLDTYAEARQSAAVSSLEGSLVALAIIEFMKPTDAGGEPRTWTGTASQLLQALGAENGPAQRIGIDLRNREWPTGARRLAGDLRRMAPALRASKIDVYFSRGGKGGARLISLSNTLLEKDRETPSASSAASAGGAPDSHATPEADDRADGTDAASSAETAYRQPRQTQTDGPDGADDRSRDFSNDVTADLLARYDRLGKPPPRLALGGVTIWNREQLAAWLAEAAGDPARLAEVERQIVEIERLRAERAERAEVF